MDASGPGGMGSRDPTCVFPVDRPLLEALDGRLGPPLDAYLMSWQVWLEPAGEDDVVLEYGSIPRPGSHSPRRSIPGLWDEVLLQLAAGREMLRLGRDRRLLESWGILEVYPGFGDPVEPERVRTWAQEALGRPALAAETSTTPASEALGATRRSLRPPRGDPRGARGRMRRVQRSAPSTALLQASISSHESR